MLNNHHYLWLSCSLVNRLKIFSFEPGSLAIQSVRSSTNGTVCPAENLQFLFQIPDNAPYSTNRRCLIASFWLALIMWRNPRPLKDSRQCGNSIIQAAVIWWRLLCVRSRTNNSLNPNVLLCRSQMSWSACDRIGVDLAVNCSVGSVVSESWGENEFHISSQHCDLDLDGESPKFDWVNTRWMSSNLDFKVKEQHASFHLTGRTMLQLSRAPGLHSGKRKVPSSVVSSG